MTRSRLAVVVGVACLTAAVALAQEQFFGTGSNAADADELQGNTPYDGRFVFVRLRYGSNLANFGFGRGQSPGWSHDYPRADLHLMKILKEITLLAPRMDGSNILGLDEPELFDYPVAYMSEPGGWRPNDAEVEGLRAYLAKGGFLIFDDFRGWDWPNLVTQMKRVLPTGQFVELDGTHPIFHSFFEIDSPLDFIPPYGEERPDFYGMYEDNDPDKRLMMIANRNNDIGEYWEFSDSGFVPIDLSNEAYKFGVNYIIYAMSH